MALRQVLDMKCAPAPPQAAMALCVGMHRVPLQSMVAPTEAGEMKAYQMLRVTETLIGRDWLWSDWLLSAVGAPTKKDASLVAVQDLPLFNELAGAVAHTRRKRKANQWTDCNGRVQRKGALQPVVVRVFVRGKDIVLANNTKSLCLHVGHSTETLDWFLAQVWADMRSLQLRAKKRTPPCNSVPGVAQHAAPKAAISSASARAIDELRRATAELRAELAQARGGIAEAPEVEDPGAGA